MATDWTMVFEKLDQANEDVDIVLMPTQEETTEALDISELARFAEALREPELSTFSIG